MNPSITKAIRLHVSTLAGFKCEYCLLPENFSQFIFHIDHIISQKHGGLTKLINLANSCPGCNYYKGSDIATFAKNSQQNLVRFFNPRTDDWNENFEIKKGKIIGLTEIGFATEKIFKFNEKDRLNFRQELIAIGMYPLKQT